MPITSLHRRLEEVMHNKHVYLFKIIHEHHGTVNVDAIDKLRAIQAAARSWGVPWTSIARECDCKNCGLTEETGGEN